MLNYGRGEGDKIYPTNAKCFEVLRRCKRSLEFLNFKNTMIMK